MSGISQFAKTRRRLLRGIALASLIALPATAHAQTGVPPSRDELGVGQAGIPERDRPTTLTIDGGGERGPCPLADPTYADVTVNFAEVRFEGLPNVAAPQLDTAWRDLAGSPIPIAKLCEVRDHAATILRQQGYLAAVQVPPQRIEEGGTVQMDVLAARLIEVQLRGNPGRSERVIAAHVAQLTEDEYFNVFEAERHLMLLQDLPGFDVRLTLRPANRGSGEVVGDILVERRPVEMRVAMHNLASRGTGREGIFTELVLNDLTGMGDQTRVSLYSTTDFEEQIVAELGHSLALGGSGLRARANFLYGESEPDIGAPFASETWVAGFGLEYPLIRKQARTLRAGIGFEMIDQQLDFGSTQLSEDDLRVIYGRLEFAAVDPASLRGFAGFTPREPRWQTAFSLELRQGLDGLGASNDCSDITDCIAPNIPISNFFADPSSGVARLEGVFEYRPAPTVTLSMSPVAQISTGPLLAYEQVSLGNFTVGRGYDPGVALGDHAIGSSFELRVGRIAPQTPTSVALQPFIFFDIAKAWTDGSLAPDPRSLASAGGGVRGKWGDQADFNLTIAKPLRRGGFQTESGDVRVLFTISARLVPWRSQ
ncbi:ShlB/FhaC/HecB family hemolysin secretion/activation protein [Qipengyuania sp. CAU 1752]